MAYYIIDKQKIKESISKLKNAFLDKDLDFNLFYSVKTNFANEVLQVIKEEGCGFEIVSELEWNLIKKFKPNSLVLNGPGKSAKLITDILKRTETIFLNIDNDSDIDILRTFDKTLLDKKIKVGIRIYLDREGVWDRFGYKIPSENLDKKIEEISDFIKLSGIHFHFSTNNFNLENYRSIFSHINEFINCHIKGLEFLNIGGGLPAANDFIHQSDIYQKLPGMIAEIFPKLKIISEAGRNIVADAVNIESRVISVKQLNFDQFMVAVDTNIMHFQCFFEKRFWIEYQVSTKKQKSPKEIVIFGNSCMQIDKIADNVIIHQEPSVGDRVIIHGVGAYSYSQAANFISKIPEVKIYE